MAKEKEILRLRSLGMSQKAIMSVVHCASRKIKSTYEKADELSITYELIKDKTDDEIEEIFGNKKEVIYYHERPDYDYVHKELLKPGVTVMLLWEEYVERCKLENKPFLKYTQFSKLYKKHVEKNNLTMHIGQKPGEKVEVDFAGQTLPIYDLSRRQIISKAYLFVAVLPFSQYIYCEATDNMKQESWINLHINMLRFFGGVPLMIVPDNLKTGIISHKKYEDIIINKAYQEMAEYYDTVIIPARVKKPKDKASVESSVGILTTQIIARLRNFRFSSIEEANECILVELDKINRKPFQKREYSRSFVYLNEELPYLRSLPEFPYEFAEWKKAIVNYNYHISFEKNFYSVPYRFLREKVDVRISRKMIEIYHHGSRIASHPRLNGVVNQYSTMEDHMPDHHKLYTEWNGERFKKWAERIGPFTCRIITQNLESVKIEEQMYQRCMSILKLSDRYPSDLIEEVSESILEKRVTCSYKNFKSYLDYLQDRNNKLAEEKENNEGALLRGADYYGGKK